MNTSMLLRRTARKVPQITVFFWIVKVITTALGESTSDYLVYHINPYLAVTLGFAVFVVALAVQFGVKAYNAWIYWLAVTMVAIFGTMAADVTHVVLGVPYLYSTGFFAICLIIVFALWGSVEKTLSIHSITTVRREAFYWLTVVVTFALGTAAGDMTAYTLKLGFLASGLLFAGVIAAIGIVHYAVLSRQEQAGRRSRNAVFAFWAAYVFTRPLGASFADWFGKPRSFGGLGWGDGVVSAVLTAFLIGFVWYLSATKLDVEKA
jgi:uncharacterized membrane-anchored protein